MARLYHQPWLLPYKCRATGEQERNGTKIPAADGHHCSCLPKKQPRLASLAVFRIGAGQPSREFACDVIQDTSTNLPPATRLSKRARLLVSEASRSSRRPQSTLHRRHTAGFFSTVSLTK